MTYQIVVARYNENIDWTNKFSNVLLYNKGKELTTKTDVISLKNVGREGHTYYTYICDHYEELSDYIFFLQGNPFDHSPHLITNLLNHINDIESNEMIEDFIFLSERILDCSLSGCRYHPNLPLLRVYQRIFSDQAQAQTQDHIKNISFKFGAGAQFMVSKKKILERPKLFYQQIVRLLEYHINPIEGYVIERFHSLIFT